MIKAEEITVSWAPFRRCGMLMIARKALFTAASVAQCLGVKVRALALVLLNVPLTCKALCTDCRREPGGSPGNVQQSRICTGPHFDTPLHAENHWNAAIVWLSDYVLSSSQFT